MKLSSIKQAWNGAEKCRQCHIRELALFADIQEDDFKQLHFPISDLELQTGDSLFKQSETPKFVYTIRTGLIKLVHFLPNGNYRIVRLLGPGDLVGIEALHGIPYLHYAFTLQNTTACQIPVETIEQLNRKSPHLYKQLIAHWQRVQSDADVWLTKLTVGNSKKRVANLLLYLDQQSSNDFFYLPGREDMGALLAIATETTSRIIAEFKRLEYLQTGHLGAYINKDQLKQIS
ncbi:hypothetical protein AU255_00510 [Methyloprofundus sedimenti]|uniref:Cyclic nucleotide-binding domain-containing protein n=1 Tax=Methyloprofundus sedimenti TaxID=1420851 RepID=A0A1V8M4M0_9GAMM|nr:Crp/Fnr family transcriptional regulator [Methyloprofundus sedimenti]OQK16426.1 hypothetical protein AU255_00510 [Methyloprofundus sedimenti]